MADWFEWNGERCTDYGIHVGTQPDITIPAERSNAVTIPGMSGSLTTKEGKDVYDNIQISIPCFIENTDRIDDIVRWLRGSGKLVIPFREDGYYEARVTNQIPFSRIVKTLGFRTFSVTFDCKPFLNIISGLEKFKFSDNSWIRNNYILDAIPVINVKYPSTLKVNKFELRIGDYGVECANIYSAGIIDFTIDCNRGIAYYTDVNGNNHNMCQYVSTIHYTDFPDPSNPSNMITSYSTDDDWPYLTAERESLVRFTAYNSSNTAITGSNAAKIEVYITPNWRTL